MGAFLNGLAHTPGLIPFGGTFMIFADYMRPPIRLAAMMGLGTDLRVDPRLHRSRRGRPDPPADGATAQPARRAESDRHSPRRRQRDRRGVEAAIANRRGPTALILSRQALPTLDRTCLGASGRGAAGRLRTGARAGGPAGDHHRQRLGNSAGAGCPGKLQQEGIGIRVVSLPCWEMFEHRGPSYRERCCRRTAGAGGGGSRLDLRLGALRRPLRRDRRDDRFRRQRPGRRD